MNSNSLLTAPEGEQSLKLNWISVLFFGAIHGLALLAPWFFSWSAGVQLASKISFPLLFIFSFDSVSSIISFFFSSS